MPMRDLIVSTCLLCIQLPPEVAVEPMITIWSTALELMEDDDESVRHQCASSVACALKSLSGM